MTDPIADMLTRMRNALAVKKKQAIIPSSKQKAALAHLLCKHGWLEKYEEKDLPGNKKELVLTFKYDEEGKSVITNLRRISKPSRRVYVGKETIDEVQNGYGIAVISTSHGLMTNKDARKDGQGGEVLCELF
jgi:small subunit ribosomal protein S8